MSEKSFLAKASVRMTKEPSDTDGQAIKIIVRLRPNLKENIISNLNNNISIANPRNQNERINYSFNHVFSEESKQVEL